MKFSLVIFPLQFTIFESYCNAVYSKDEEKIEEKIVYSIFKEVYIKGLSDVDQEINIREVNCN